MRSTSTAGQLPYDPTLHTSAPSLRVQSSALRGSFASPNQIGIAATKSWSHFLPANLLRYLEPEQFVDLPAILGELAVSEDALLRNLPAANAKGT